MSNSFFIVLPSNTKSYDENKTNKFRVHLPRKLEFDGNWVCGLHSIVYPNTWPAIGTTELQYIIVSLKSGTKIRFPIPKGSYLTPQELETTLYSGVVREVDNLKKLISEDDEVNRKRRRREINDSTEIVEDNVESDDDDESKLAEILKQEMLNRAVVREKINASEKVQVLGPPSTSNEVRKSVSETAIESVTDSSDSPVSSTDSSASKIRDLTVGLRLEGDRAPARDSEAREGKTKETPIPTPSSVNETSAPQKTPKETPQTSPEQPAKPKEAIASSSASSVRETARLSSSNVVRQETTPSAKLSQTKEAVAPSSASSVSEELRPSEDPAPTLRLSGSSSDSPVRKTGESRAEQDRPSGDRAPTREESITSASSVGLRLQGDRAQARESASTFERSEIKRERKLGETRVSRHQIVDTFDANIEENEERSEIVDKIDGLKTVDINKIKEGYESIRNSTFKIQKKTFGKGEIFNKQSDLRERWIQNPKKDWKSLEELLKILGQREPRIYSDRDQSIRAHIEYRKKIIAELAEEGSEFHSELSNLINDQDKFFNVLKEENFSRRSSRYMNFSRLSDLRYETGRMLELVSAVKFEYLEDIRRFTLKISDPDVSEVYLSDQICYVLGFDVGNPIKNGDISKYACDLRGGVSHICVYANGITDQMIVGDKLASLLQIVAVTGAPGDVIEKKYDAPLFNKVISKNVDEIEIEIRTLEGRLVPFDYGVVIITLIFKKLILF